MSSVRRVITSASPGYAPCRILKTYPSVQQRFELLRRDAGADAGALLLQQHGHARIALAPAAAQGFRQLLVSKARDLHRYALLAGQRQRKAHVLVRQPQREGRRIVGARQEKLGEPVEGPLAPRSPLPQGPEQGQR